MRNEVVWEPIPGTSQELALNSPCDVTLYTGSRGPGKSDTQLFSYRQHVGQGYGKFWRGVIFDRHYKNLDDLVSKSKRWFPLFEDGASFKESKADYKWVWPTGEELLFRSAETVADYIDFHGQEFPFIGWNELTNYQTLDLFDMMMSCNRSSYVPEINGFIGAGHNQGPLLDDENEGGRFVAVNPWTGELPDPIPLKVFATTNPFGAGHNAVKMRFIDPAEYGQPIETLTPLYNPRTKQDEIVRRTQVSIFGSWRENIYLDPKYIATIKSVKDVNLRKAWDEGDWDIVAGGPLDDVWAKHVHVIPRFRVPYGWYIDRAFDWGSSEPFSYGLFAEANGENAYMPDGSVFCPPPGTIVQIGEIYGAEALGTNVGLRWAPKTIARTIKAYEQDMISQGWISREVAPGAADNQIRNVNDTETDTIEKRMAAEGIHFTASDKSPGSRVNGLDLIRERLSNARQREGAGLFFTTNCIASFSTIPAVPRSTKNPNDIDTNSEDHAYDMVRYRLLDGNSHSPVNLSASFPGSR